MDTTDILATAHATLTAAVRGMIADNSWQKYLEVQATFHRYSFQNTLWLMAQAAERGVSPTRFAGYETWKKLGRQVRKGEKGFKVLAPIIRKMTLKDEGSEPGVNEVSAKVLRGFRVTTTFEMSQTDGKEMPSVVQLLSGTSPEVVSYFDQLATWSATNGFSVSRTTTAPANGYCDLTGKRIAVGSHLSDVHALKTLVHEIAHSLMHTNEADCHSRPVMEVEAESVAFVVLRALGIASDDYSFGYVACWSKGDADVVRATGERVQKTAKTILTALAIKDDSEAV